MNLPDPPLAVPVALPATFPQAARRGLANLCPRCGGAQLFRKWLTPVDRCRACGQDWSIAQADDIPAYIVILVTGHLLAPLMIFLILEAKLSAVVSGTIIFVLAVAMVLGSIQPAKGAVIALQWWLGLMGFRRERPEAP